MGSIPLGSTNLNIETGAVFGLPLLFLGHAGPFGTALVPRTIVSSGLLWLDPMDRLHPDHQSMKPKGDAGLSIFGGFAFFFAIAVCQANVLFGCRITRGRTRAGNKTAQHPVEK